MKTKTTDRYGLYPWAMSFVAAANFASAYRSIDDADLTRAGLYVCAGLIFLGLAIKRLWDIRRDKVDEVDPTVIRKQNAPNH